VQRPPFTQASIDGRALSRVGLGAWAFGGVGWGPQDDRDSIAAIHHAVELGVNWIDTAAVYGEGHSETVVGEALAALPEAERPLIFTKSGLRIDADSGKTYRDLSPASLRVECDESLKRLRLQRIDLYQLHWPVDDPEVVELAWDTLEELRREGKIRCAGASNFSSELLQRCARRGSIDFVQAPLSLLDRRSAQSVLPWADAHRVPAIAYSPLESGLLSGHFSAQRLAGLSQDDWRRRRPQFQAPRVDRGLELVELLRPIADELGLSLLELAVAWPLQWRAVAGAIVGARSRAQVDGWIGAQDLTLEAEVLDAIQRALTATEAGLGSSSRPLLG
jgi:aryl-alcohol dehydrogenase-like predicted oxidoreductase